ncbi:MAG: hypothetical protein JWP18_2323, partial [Solirubrobacterales bacterium]|nr:hypothetical protein [Solirubrobacterales bacterium]
RRGGGIGGLGAGRRESGRRERAAQREAQDDDGAVHAREGYGTRRRPTPPGTPILPLNDNVC